jgi:hypothetical protein
MGGDEYTMALGTGSRRTAPPPPTGKGVRVKHSALSARTSLKDGR